MTITKHEDGTITITDQIVMQRRLTLVNDFIRVEKTFNCSERKAKSKFKQHVKQYFVMV